MRKVITFLIIVISIYLSQTTALVAEEKRELPQSSVKAIEDLIRQDAIYIESYYDVYFDPDIWSLMEVRVKKTFTKALATYCGNKAGADNSGEYYYYCTVYDKMSGKKIAKCDAWGFKVYQ
jgi:hypothetical protein|tara:strand:- start:134 stop:496 length:363 start_codon:yes stop_codon:yes gene_type:complete